MIVPVLLVSYAWIVCSFFDSVDDLRRKVGMHSIFLTVIRIATSELVKVIDQRAPRCRKKCT